MVEKAVLSLMLQDSATWIPRAASDGLSADHFHVHQSFYRMVIRRIEEGKTLELTALITEEQAAGNIDAVGGPAGVTDIYTFSPNGQHYTEHLRVLREYLARRRAVIASENLGEITDASDPEEMRLVLKAALDGIAAALCAPGGMKSARQAAEAFCDQITTDFQNGDFPGLPTGIHEIDTASGGMRPGEFWVIGAETSGGKSVILLQIAACAADSGKRVLVFTLEMLAASIIARMVSFHGRIPYGQITQPKTTAAPMLERIKRAASQICKWPLWIDDRPKLSATMIEAECIRRRDIDGPIDLVVIDYLQLVDGDRKREESRQEEISRVSKSLKNLAKTLGCPVLTASQLNDDGRIRESRDPAFDADAVLLIGSDGVKAAKLRNAARGQVLPIVLNGEFQRFERNDVPAASTVTTNHRERSR